MIKKIVVALPFLLGLALNGYAQDSYMVPSVVYTDDDEDRAVDDSMTGGQIAFGRHFGDRFAIEGLIGRARLGGVDEHTLTEGSVNGLVVFRRDARLSPYLLGGLGLLDQNREISGDNTALVLNAGVGVNLSLTDHPAKLRIEHRYRMADGSGQSWTDRLTSVGVVIPFGATSRPPTPLPAPAEDPDSDGDGVPDSRDACANTPSGHRVDSRGCSLDGDRDGVADADDQCPNTPAGAEVDANGCQLDGDGDGVVDGDDRCPNTAEGVRVDVNGCEITEVIELPGVNFETNSDRLLPGADNVLRDAAATLRRYPDLVVQVAGHTDSAGAADYNQGLSERRANTVRDYLINAGVGEDNLSAMGYGEAEPIADNGTADGRARNRRVELRIIE